MPDKTLSITTENWDRIAAALAVEFPLTETRDGRLQEWLRREMGYFVHGVEKRQADSGPTLDLVDIGA